MLGDEIEVAIHREEMSALGDRHRRDETVRQTRGHPVSATRIGDLGCRKMVFAACEQESKIVERTFELEEL